MRGVPPTVVGPLLEWHAGEKRLDQPGPARDARLRVVAAVDDEPQPNEEPYPHTRELSPEPIPFLPNLYPSTKPQL